jgi:hypothetical protein
MTPDRAREVIHAQSKFPYWGNYQKFMTPEEVAHVQELFANDRSGNITFGAIVHRIARRGYWSAPPDFDERDAQLARDRLAEWDAIDGARVGDWIAMRDGTMRRFTHHWGDGLQTTVTHHVDASFYFSGDCMSFSGSLDPTIPLADILPTSETKNGSAWFFHHGQVGAHRGVHFAVPCRVFKQRETS